MIAKKLRVVKQIMSISDCACWLIGVGVPTIAYHCSHNLHMGVDYVGHFEWQPHLIGLKSFVGVMLVNFHFK